MTDRKFDIFELGDAVDEIHAGADKVPGISQSEKKWKKMLEGATEHAELLVSSKGAYLYTCFCGVTTNGSMTNFRMSPPWIECLDYHCNRVIDAIWLNEKYASGPTGSPRAFLIRD